MVAILNLVSGEWTGYWGTDVAGAAGLHPIKSERRTVTAIIVENNLRIFLFISELLVYFLMEKESAAVIRRLINKG
ncbi:MAG: hypothetical protein MUO89_02135 [Dehalococcoidia bacterium]|nr:hypothetical protein [Dehalococcoidia bacterium]